MGSRIEVSLQSLLGSATIKVELVTKSFCGDAPSVENNAIVTFNKEAAGTRFLLAKSGTYVFDYDTDSISGQITLSRDFNFYRNPEVHGALMRELFENSVSFTVHH